MIDRWTEIKMVKDALAAAGIEAKVRHGMGTACEWLHIKIPRQGSPDETQALGALTVLITQEITGRHGEYAGRINWSEYDGGVYHGADYTDQVGRWERS